MHRVKIRRPLWIRLNDYAEEEELSVYEVVDRALGTYLEAQKFAEKMGIEAEDESSEDESSEDESSEDE